MNLQAIGLVFIVLRSLTLALLSRSCVLLEVGMQVRLSFAILSDYLCLRYELKDVGPSDTDHKACAFLPCSSSRFVLLSGDPFSPFLGEVILNCLLLSISLFIGE